VEAQRIHHPGIAGQPTERIDMTISSTNNQQARGRRVLFTTTALAGAVALVVAGGHLAVAQANATSTTPPLASSAPRVGTDQFADVVARVKGAVVNVAVTEGHAKGHGQPRMMIPEDGPAGEMFRRFFGEKGMPDLGDAMPREVQGQGSGFIVDPAGYIVTNHHVIDGAKEITVSLADGSKHKARVQGWDDKTDIAVLKIDAGKPLPYVQFGSSDDTRIGDWVLAVGNPFGLGGTVTAGIVSARGRDIQSGPYDDYLQVDAPINRGNSGGPLFDTTGRVVGINTAIFSPSGGNVGIGFAIPASVAATVVDQLRSQGHIERGWLGVLLQPVSAEVAESLGLAGEGGSLVANVEPDSPAAKAGLKPGDVVLSLNGKPLENVKALARAVADTRPGTALTLEVSREHKSRDVQVVIGAPPGEGRVAAEPAGASPAPRLGLALSPLTEESRAHFGIEKGRQGVVVMRVERDSPAARAGIRAGSLISMVGQQQVAAPEDVVKAVAAAASEKRPSVLLLIEFDGEKSFVPVRLAA
jgi:serine protease Do